jgi:hypothetical protein
MDALINSLESFRFTNNKTQFDIDLDNVINKFNEQSIPDPNQEWETICSNYSKIKYLDEMIKFFYIPDSEKFLFALNRFTERLDSINLRYLNEISWERYPTEQTKEIKRLLDLSYYENDTIGKIGYCLKAYKRLVPIIEDIRNEKYTGDVYEDQEFIEHFNFKRRRL